MKMISKAGISSSWGPFSRLHTVSVSLTTLTEMQWKCNGRMGAQRASLTLIQSVQAVFESEYSST